MLCLPATPGLVLVGFENVQALEAMAELRAPEYGADHFKFLYGFEIPNQDSQKFPDLQQNLNCDP